MNLKKYLPTETRGIYLPEQTSHIDGSFKKISESNTCIKKSSLV